MADRLTITFAGTKTVDIDLDPGEFAGKPVPEVTEDIRRTLREIAPGVSFFEGDLHWAAGRVLDATR